MGERAEAGSPTRLDGENARRSFAFRNHADGTIAATADPNGWAVAVWDIVSGRRRALLNAGRGNPSYLTLSPDGKTLAMSNQNGRITIWNMPARKQTRTLPGHRGYCVSMAFSPDGRLLVTSGEDKRSSSGTWQADAT
jgi:WD40 repeat protein